MYIRALKGLDIGYYFHIIILWSIKILKERTIVVADIHRIYQKLQLRILLKLSDNSLVHRNAHIYCRMALPLIKYT